ncbi:MAG: recombinase RecT [Thermotogota bacterium]
MSEPKQLPGAVEPEAVVQVGSLLARWRSKILQALPKYIDPERFTRIVLTTIRQTPVLQKCSVESIMGAVMEAAADGLELDGVDAALVPYWNSELRCFEAQYQAMYQGLLRLCRRSVNVKAIHAHEVYEGDVFRVALGSSPSIVHEPQWLNSSDDKISHVYVVFDFKDGAQQFEIMTREQIETIMKRSKSYQKKGAESAWGTSFGMMARKTVLRRGMKYAPTDDHSKEVAFRDERREFTSTAEVVQDGVLEQPRQSPALEQAKILFGEVRKWCRATGEADPQGAATKLLRDAVEKDSMIEWTEQDVVAARQRFEEASRPKAQEQTAKKPKAKPSAKDEAPPEEPPAPEPQGDGPEPAHEPVTPEAAGEQPAMFGEGTQPKAEEKPRPSKPTEYAKPKEIEAAVKAMRRWCADIGADAPPDQDAIVVQFWREMGAPDLDHVPAEVFAKVRKASDTEDTFKVVARSWVADHGKSDPGKASE